MIKKIEIGKNLIILDAGDFIGRKSYRQSKVASLMFEVFGKIGYTGILPGEQELSLGISELKKLSKKHDVPIICGNIVNKNDGEEIFPSYIIKSVKQGGFFRKKCKIGITGVIDDLLIDRLPKSEKEKISITSPEKTLEKIIPVLREKADVIILLSHLGRGKSLLFNGKFPEIDIAIAAHSRPPLMMEPYSPGKTLILKEVSKGKDLSWLQICFDKKRKILKIEEDTINLRIDLPEDPIVLEMIEAFENKMPEPPFSVSAQSYITAKNCRSCHLKEFSQWVKTPHARTFDSLISNGSENARECVKCHVTGAGDHMGFGDFESTPELINVQCEACHGPGNYHAKKPGGKYGKISMRTCTGCHDKEYDPEFDFNEKIKKVLHR